MNTASLQQRHKSEYRQFFSSNMVVFSLPCNISIAGDISWDNALHIRQKLPLRMYIWLSRHPKPGVHFTKLTSYSHFRDKFYERQLPEHLPFVPRFLNELMGGSNLGEGVEVSILSEVSRTKGLCVSQLMLFALTVAHAWITDKGIVSRMHLDAQRPIHESLEDQGEMHKLLMLYLDVAKRTPQPSGVFWIISSLYSGTFPVVLFWENTEKNQKAPSLFWFTFDQFLSDDHWVFPYSTTEVSVLYSGYPYLSENLAFLKRRFESGTEAQVKSALYDVMGDNDVDTGGKNLPSFLLQSSGYSHEKIEEIHTGVQSHQSLELFMSLLRMQKNVHDRGYVQEYIHALERYTQEQVFIYGMQKEMRELYHDIWEQYRDAASVPAIVPNESAMIGGCYLIVSPLIMQQEVSRTLAENLRKNHRECSMVYSSWEDGVEAEGFLLDQNIQELQYHELTDRNIGMCQCNKKEYVVPRSRLKEFSQWKVLFDLDAKKIYANGLPVNSTHIPSQKATIEIVEMLLENGWQVKSRDLPRSSYAASKSEMHGKILTPLNKVCMKATWEPMPMRIEWGLHEFELHISFDFDRICVFKK